MKVEKVEVTIEAFILAMKRDPDNDFHIQIGDEPDQVIVEVPPGQDYCDARQSVFQLFQNDGGGSLSKHPFDNPPKVRVTGYLFLDSVHAPRGGRFCKSNGGRGMLLGSDGASHVVGLWELHPVIELKSVSQ